MNPFVFADFNSSDPLKILGVSREASKKEIKQAFNRLIKMVHSDRSQNDELTKKVTHAKNLLLDPDYREKHAAENDSTAYPTVGDLLLDKRLSEEFAQDLKRWEAKNPTLTDHLSFEFPNTQNLASPFPNPSLEVLKNSFENFLRGNIDRFDDILNSFDTLSYLELHELTPKIKDFLTTDHILPSFASRSFEVISPKEYNKKYSEIQFICQAIRVSSAAPFQPPTLEEINKTRELIKQIEEKNFYKTPVKICRTFQNFINTKSSKTSADVIDPASSEGKALVVIPKVKILTLANSNKDSTHCKVCTKALGFFKSYCAKCGAGCCGNCLTFQKFPEFNKPIRVCHLHGLKEYAYEWRNAVIDSETSDKINKQYLLLMHAAGLAKKNDFLKWRDLFLASKEDKKDLVFLCHYLGQGNWIELAQKYIAENNFALASECLSQMRKIVIKDLSQLTEKEKTSSTIEYLENDKVKVTSPFNSADWRREADLQIKTNIYLGLFCYRKAGLDAYSLFNLALKNFDEPYGQELFIFAQQSSIYFERETLNFRFHILNSQSKNKIKALAFYFHLKQYTQEQWIEGINALDNLEDAELLLKYMHLFIKCDFSQVKLSENIDFLRWPYLGPIEIDNWLNLFIEQIDSSHQEERIAYFFKYLPKINLLEKRDEYLAKSEYLKAFLCHSFSTNKLSWEDFGKKIENKSENAFILCQDLLGNDLSRLGEDYLQEGLNLAKVKHQTKEIQSLKNKKIGLAFRCFYYAKNYQALYKNLSLASESNVRLSILSDLWKVDSSQDYLTLICEELLMAKEHSKLQDLVRAALKENKITKLTCCQLLFKANLPIELQIGLLESYASSCQTAESKKWLQEALGTIERFFKQKLESAFMKTDFQTLLSLCDLLTPTSWECLNKLLQTYSRLAFQNAYQAGLLFMRSLTHLYHPKGPQFWEAMEDLTKAMESWSHDEAMPFYSQVIKKITQLPPESLKFHASDLAEFHFPNLSQFVDHLKGAPYLKLLKLADKTFSKLDSLTAAMGYIDLKMSELGTEGIVGSCFSAAAEFLKLMSTVKDAKKIYAYKRAIAKLVRESISIAYRHLCPASALYTYKTAISLLTTAYDVTKKISQKERELLDFCYQEFHRLIQIVPMAQKNLVSLFDHVLLNYLNRKVSSVFLKEMSATLDKDTVKWQYQLFAELWKGTIDDEGLDFEEERERTIHGLLLEENQTIQQVENLVSWPLIKRDAGGWILPDSSGLNLDGDRFARVSGVHFNLETGEIEFEFEKSKIEKENIFNMQDLLEVLEKGIQAAIFTLDQKSPSQPESPLQLARYSPPELAGTNYFGTVMHSDIILKELGMGVEVSAKAPFAFKDAEENLLKRFPTRIQNLFKDHYQEKHDQKYWKEVCHRFWIEAGDLPYTVNQTENGKKISYQFGKCVMSVKKHLMERDKEGNLIDAEKDDDESMEAKFAEMMTKEFTNLGNDLPEFERLREYAVFQTISTIVKNIAKNSLDNYTKTRNRAYLTICDTFKRMNFSTIESKFDLISHPVGIPAVFKKEHLYKIYGGVNMQATPRQVNNLPSQGPLTTNFRYIIRFDGVMMHGTTTAVDPVTGNPYPVNMSKAYIPGTEKAPQTLLWVQSCFPDKEVDHYTQHKNGAAHIHYSDGTSVCDYQGSKTTWVRGSGGRHVCGQN